MLFSASCSAGFLFLIEQTYFQVIGAVVTALLPVAFLCAQWF